jgi:hypothetical protein
VDITGGIEVRTRSDDGAENVATATRIELTLIDEAKVRSSTNPKPAASTQPAAEKDRDRSAIQSLAGDDTFLANKAVEKTRLIDNVELKSVLNDANGQVLRRTHLFAPEVIYDQPLQALTIPHAGRMLYEDRREAPAGEQPQPGDFENMRGATAFQWSRELIYNDVSLRAVMTGDVLVVHQASDKSASYRLTSESVSAEFDRAEVASTRPTGETISPISSSLRLSRVTADGNVRFVSEGLQFEASTVTYDPVNDLLVARGRDRVPAVLLDEQGVSKGTFSELTYNLRTEQIAMKDFRAQVRR